MCWVISLGYGSLHKYGQPSHFLQTIKHNKINSETAKWIQKQSYALRLRLKLSHRLVSSLDHRYPTTCIYMVPNPKLNIYYEVYFFSSRIDRHVTINLCIYFLYWKLPTYSLGKFPLLYENCIFYCIIICVCTAISDYQLIQPATMNILPTL